LIEKKTYLPNSRIAFRKIEGKMVLVNPLENRIVTLNETGTAIWGLLDGRDTDCIANEIQNAFDVTYDQARNDTCEFLERMQKMEFVVSDRRTEP
jgi:tryptophanase